MYDGTLWGEGGRSIQIIGSKMEYVGLTTGKVVASTSPGNDATLIYEVPALHAAEVHLIIPSNDDSNNKEINIQLRTNGSYIYLYRKFPVSNNAAVNLLDGSPLFLKAGDRIVAYKESGNYLMDLTVSFKQMYRGVKYL
jgi:hypothetical protein